MDNVNAMNSMNKTFTVETATAEYAGGEANVEDTPKKGGVWGRFVTAVADKFSSMKHGVGNAFRSVGAFMGLCERKTEVIPSEQVQNLMTKEAEMADYAAKCTSALQEKAQALTGHQAEVERLRTELDAAEGCLRVAEEEVGKARADKECADAQAVAARCALIEGLEQEFNELEDTDRQATGAMLEEDRKLNEKKLELKELSEQVCLAETLLNEKAKNVAKAEKQLKENTSKLAGQEAAVKKLQEKLESKNAAMDETTSVKKKVGLQSEFEVIFNTLSKTEAWITSLKESREALEAELAKAKTELDNAEADLSEKSERVADVKMEVSCHKCAFESKNSLIFPAFKRWEGIREIWRKYQVEDGTQAGSSDYKTQVPQSSESSEYGVSRTKDPDWDIEYFDIDTNIELPYLEVSDEGVR